MGGKCKDEKKDGFHEYYVGERNTFKEDINYRVPVWYRVWSKLIFVEFHQYFSD